MRDISIKMYIVSDAVGETALRVANAVLAQYPQIKTKHIQRYPFIQSKDELLSILHDAKIEEAIVVSTIVNHELANFADVYSQENGIDYHNVLTRLMTIIQDAKEVLPLEESGLLQQMDQQYFDRVSAIEFSVKYDDGKNHQGYTKADIVLLGISRTSKTPLSMYLANKGYKVANLPLIPEVPIPKEIYDVDSRRIFGLMASPRYISNIRTERVKVLGVGDSARYNSLERVKDELMFSKDLYRELGIRVIDVENKSIEETAAEIETIYKRTDMKN